MFIVRWIKDKIWRINQFLFIIRNCNMSGKPYSRRSYWEINHYRINMFYTLHERIYTSTFIKGRNPIVGFIVRNLEWLLPLKFRNLTSYFVYGSFLCTCWDILTIFLGLMFFYYFYISENWMEAALQMSLNSMISSRFMRLHDRMKVIQAVLVWLLVYIRHTALFSWNIL